MSFLALYKSISNHPVSKGEKGITNQLPLWKYMKKKEMKSTSAKNNHKSTTGSTML